MTAGRERQREHLADLIAPRIVGSRETNLNIADYLIDRGVTVRTDQYDQLAALTGDLQGRMLITPQDFDLQTAGRDYEAALIVGGYPDVAARIHVLTEVLTGQLPCGHQPRTALVEEPDVQAMHEPLGPPVDGREVDREPADTFRTVGTFDIDDGPVTPVRFVPAPPDIDDGAPEKAWHPHTWVRRPPLLPLDCACATGRDHAGRPIETDDGVSADPPGAARLRPTTATPSRSAPSRSAIGGCAARAIARPVTASSAATTWPNPASRRRAEMTTTTKVATRLGDAKGTFTGDAGHYRLSPPLRDEDWGDEVAEHEFVVVSATVVPFTGAETYIFPSDESGQVTDWGELPGSYRGGMSHEAALSNAGYSVTT